MGNISDIDRVVDIVDEEIQFGQTLDDVIHATCLMCSQDGIWAQREDKIRTDHSICEVNNLEP
jgi:hypothetical protein